ncbi:MAG: substrate-binding domain-containing protein [Pirellulales bacterium]
MKSQKMSALFLGTLAAMTFAMGCKQTARPANELTLATTTSVQDSGLLDVLIPRFREQTGIEVHVVAVGSGQALALGRRGDADVLLTHAPAAEQKYMDEGWGQELRPIMHNDFILVGPKSDPATINGQTSITEAFTRLAQQRVRFVSRGDESGTHLKEMDVWRKAGREPHGDWYIGAGAGMAAVLRIAQEKQAYTLADRGTFLALGNELDLIILSEGDPFLKNDYAVIITSKKQHPHLNAEAAQKFADFLTDSTTKSLIAEFGVEEFGEPLFLPEK